MKYQETKNKISSLWEKSQQTVIATDKVDLTFPSLIIDKSIRNPKFYETNWVNLSLGSQSVSGDTGGEYPVYQSVSLEVDLTIKEEFLPFVNPSILIDSSILDFTKKTTTKIIVENYYDETTNYIYADGILMYRGVHFHINAHKLFIYPNELHEINFIGEETYIKYPKWDSGINAWRCYWDAALIYPIGHVYYPETFYYPPPSPPYTNLDYYYTYTRSEVKKEETNLSGLSNNFPEIQLMWIKLGVDKFRLRLSGNTNIMTKVVATPSAYQDINEIYNYQYGAFGGSPHWHLVSESYPLAPAIYFNDYNTEPIQGESLRMKLLVAIEPPTEFNEVKKYEFSRE